MKKRLPLILPILVFLIGFGLGKWQNLSSAPISILESGEWHEKVRDDEVFLTFGNGKLRIRYIEENGYEEVVVVPYSQTDKQTLLFDKKALESLDKSAYFRRIPAGATTMELVILHTDDKEGYPNNIYVGWKFFMKEDSLLDVYSSNVWSKQ